MWRHSAATGAALFCHRWRLAPQLSRRSLKTPASEMARSVQAGSVERAGMRAAQGGTNAMFDEMKRGFRAAAISLMLCMPLVSSLARADDCRDALIAESCACQS